MDAARRLIAHFGLEPHPAEGGYFRESYRATETLAAAALPQRYAGPRALGTAIYYLLTAQTCSCLHRLASDEIFHFYHGDPVELLLLPSDDEEGAAQLHRLGTDWERGMVSQLIVPRGAWQGARLQPGGAYALLGTTVAPGFEYADYEAGDPAHLTDRFPAHAELIQALAPPA